MEKPKNTAFLFSLSFVIFQAVFGTADIENSVKFDRAFASRYLGPRVGDMAVTNGIGSYWGIPVFDATQGFGYRLPTQGSLGQSPFIFLRWFASTELIQLIYLGFAIFLCSWTIGNYCREHIKNRVQWSILLLHMAILGPLVLFSVVNEWQTTAVGFCSRVVLIFFVFHQTDVQINQRNENSRSRWSIAVTTALFLIAVGHPGEWTLSLPPLIMIIFRIVGQRTLSLSLSFKNYFYTQITPQLLIGFGATIALLLNVSELLIEFGRPLSSQIRVAQYTGITFDQIPSLSSYSEYQKFVELTVAFGMSILGPIVNIFFSTNGRYEFSAFSIFVVVFLDYLICRRSAQERSIRSLNSGLALAILIIGFYLTEIFDFMPALLKSSGAYQHAPQLLIVSVLLWISDREHRALTLHAKTNRFSKKTGSIIRKFAIFIAITGIVVQPFSLLKDTSPQGIRNFEAAIREREKGLVKNFRYTDLGFVLAFEGYPTLNNEPKTRNTSTLMMQSAFNQVVIMPDAKTADLFLFRDFASILMTSIEDSSKFTPNKAELRQNLESGGLDLSSRDLLTKYFVYHTFTIAEDELVLDETRCPLLDVPECIHIVSTGFYNPRAVPRWKLGSGEVLATYEWAVPANTWGVLVPMDFDRTLRIKDKGINKPLKTFSHYGLLAVQIPSGRNSGTFEITIEPDWRMRLRSATAYYSLFCFGFALVRLRRINTSTPKKV